MQKKKMRNFDNFKVTCSLNYIVNIQNENSKPRFLPVYLIPLLNWQVS